MGKVRFHIGDLAHLFSAKIMSTDIGLGKVSSIKSDLAHKGCIFSKKDLTKGVSGLYICCVDRFVLL